MEMWRWQSASYYCKLIIYILGSGIFLLIGVDSGIFIAC